MWLFEAEQLRSRMDQTVSTLKKTTYHGVESEHWNESQSLDRLNKSTGGVLALMEDHGGVTVDPRKKLMVKTKQHGSSTKYVKSVNSSLIKDYTDSPTNAKKNLTRTQKVIQGMSGMTVP